MKLIDLKLTNFRKISNLPQPTITFHPDINVLVGANNAGKTSILKAIQKLFQAEAIEPKDLNYLVKDGNLAIEGNIYLKKEQWESFLRLTASSLGQKESMDFSSTAKTLASHPLFLQHNVEYIDRKQANQYVKTDLGGNIIDSIGIKGTDNKILIPNTIDKIGHSNFYNIYKTPLFLDSKGELRDNEPFVPLNQIENEANPQRGNIRGLLYALKKKDPKAFEQFKERLLEIFTELEDVDIIHNEDLGQFELILHEKLQKNGNTEEVTYDINNVGQGMQSLVMMLSTILLLKPSIVLMDEPEVHMHPSLIKEFVKYLRLLSQETQFIITTHSLVFIQEVGLDKVFSLKNEIEQKGIIVSKIDDKNKLLETIQFLGKYSNYWG